MQEHVTLQQALNAFRAFVIQHSSYEGRPGTESRVGVSKTEALGRFLEEQPQFQASSVELYRSCNQAEFTFNASRWVRRDLPV